MDWWNDAISWLNDNSGAVSALATLGTVLFTAVAAIAAWTTIHVSHRRERSNLQLAFRSNRVLVGSEHKRTDVIELCIMNSGPATPLWTRIRSSNSRGYGQTQFDPPEPGELIRPLPELPRPTERVNHVLEWMEPDGRIRRIRCSYQAVEPLDDRGNERGVLEGLDDWQPRKHRPRPLQRRRPLFLRRWLQRSSTAPVEASEQVSELPHETPQAPPSS